MKKTMLIILILLIHIPLILADNAQTQAYGENIPPTVEDVLVTPYTFNQEDKSGSIKITIKDLNGIDDMKINGKFKISLFITRKGGLGRNFKKTKWCEILRYTPKRYSLLEKKWFFIPHCPPSCYTKIDCCKMRLTPDKITVMDETTIVAEVNIKFLRDCIKDEEYFIEVRAWDKHDTFGSWMDYSDPKPDFEYKKKFLEFTATGKACFLEDEEICWFGHCYTFEKWKCYQGNLTVREGEIEIETTARTVIWEIERYSDFTWLVKYRGINDEWDYLSLYAWRKHVRGCGPKVTFKGKK